MVGQLITVAGVVLGALTTLFANFVMTRQNNRHALATRWDVKKLDAYVEFIDRIKANSFVINELYYAGHSEVRLPPQRSMEAVLADVEETGRARDRAFENVLLLAGVDVVDAAHAIKTAIGMLDWQARGELEGTPEMWIDRQRAAVDALNRLHDLARRDLGVPGAHTGIGRPYLPSRDLPPRYQGLLHTHHGSRTDVSSA
ncbi:hypothetical protein [Nocardia macrotermitis]|uniref:Uncharacterized protein n=1 Tax=Nocardia macrotermitis TaxID=2585198 RepID=A0A7K0DF53_9NOCA|nr:hypothetical protein [Nocardia macrotermitis]MQY24416.1 hypothetical protein [Nocardia macrotermitis]